MDKRMILANVAASFLLFFINVILGAFKLKSKKVFSYFAFKFGDITEENFSGNFAQMIVTPSVFIAILAGLCQNFSCVELSHNLWLTVPFYWILRFISIIWHNLLTLTNWKIQIEACIISILLSEMILYFVVKILIKNNIEVFISLEEFRNAFWFAIIAYIATLIWNISKYRMVGKNVFSAQLKLNTIIRRYNKFYIRYHEFIEEVLKKNCIFKSEHYKNHFICLLYSIMIYEDHNRPPWIRFFEYVFKTLLWKKKFSLGIMQVQSEFLISNETSIKYAIQKLYDIFNDSETNEKLEKSIKNYNLGDDYCEEVMAIYDELVEHMKLNPIDFYRVKIKRKNCVNNKTEQ